MKVWADFYDWVNPELPGCNNALVTQYLRSTAIAFLDRTQLYTSTLDAIPLVEDEYTYTFDVPSGYEVARVLDMKWGEDRLFPRTTDQLSAMYMNWETVTGPPEYYTHETPNDFRVVPIPDSTSDDDVTPRVVLRPTRTGLGIEDWIFDRWVETIAAGVKAALMVMPGKPWSNFDMAGFYQRQYNTGRGEAVVAAQKSLTRTSLQVQMRRV